MLTHTRKHTHTHTCEHTSTKSTQIDTYVHSITGCLPSPAHPSVRCHGLPRDLVSFWTQRKDYGRAIRLAERLAAASPQPRVRKELQGSLALLYFEQSLRQPPPSLVAVVSLSWYGGATL